MVRKGLVEKVVFGERLAEVMSGGRPFQEQGIANAKAQGQEHGWHVQETAKIKSG